MVHGGCWQTEIADRRIMNWIADDLRQRGIAVWNIDYRGVDRAGGGYPGTFLDAAAAADALRDHAARAQSRSLASSSRSAIAPAAISLCGWRGAAALPAGSAAAHRPTRCRSRRVVSLGGLPDLEEAARPPGSGCGTEVDRAADRRRGRPDVYRRHLGAAARAARRAAGPGQRRCRTGSSRPLMPKAMRGRCARPATMCGCG